MLCCSSSVRLSKIFAAKSCDRLIHVESDSWSFETSSSICLPLGKKYCTLLFCSIGIAYKKCVSITTFSKICFTFLDKLQKNLSEPINLRAAQNIAEGRVVSIPALEHELLPKLKSSGELLVTKKLLIAYTIVFKQFYLYVQQKS